MQNNYLLIKLLKFQEELGFPGKLEVKSYICPLLVEEIYSTLREKHTLLSSNQLDTLYDLTDLTALDQGKEKQKSYIAELLMRKEIEITSDSYLRKFPLKDFIVLIDGEPNYLFNIFMQSIEIGVYYNG